MPNPADALPNGHRPVAAGVVLASGSGTRIGGELNKVYLPLAGRQVVSWSLDALSTVGGLEVLVLVVRPADHAHTAWVLEHEFTGSPVEVVPGGATRQESELMALRHLAGRIGTGEIDTVLIHDAARPLVRPELVAEILRTARQSGGAIPGLPRTDLVSVRPAGDQVTDAGHDQLVTVQTPQGFRAGELLAAYEQAAREGFVGTDTAACMARFSDLPVRCITGDPRNFKITYPHDVELAERVLAATS